MHNCSIPEPIADRAAELSRLRLLARKVALVHGGHHPAMKELATVVDRIADAPQTSIADSDHVQFHQLTAAYTPWPEACGSVRALFAGLHALRS
jgi:iron-sulfur cluster repair protein YtfE (RIC family)